MPIIKQRIGNFVNKILPAVYDEALSYYEVLVKLTAKVNEIINNENNQNEMLLDLKARIEELEGR